MKCKWGDIENAFLFVSMAPMLQNHAVLNMETGKIHYKSEMGDIDEFPQDTDEQDKYIEIPHRNDLNLGRDLVFEFVSKFLPEHLEYVRKIFRKKRAYSKYKILMERIGKLEEWFKYENSVIDKTLSKWCKENGIEIDRS